MHFLKFYSRRKIILCHVIRFVAKVVSIDKKLIERLVFKKSTARLVCFKIE